MNYKANLFRRVPGECSTVIITAIIVTLTFSDNVYSSTDSVSIYTPAFLSQGTLEEQNSKIGENAAAFLYLQLWRTLRIPIKENGEYEFASNGVVWWDSPRPKLTSHLVAERLARNSLAQMTYWGLAFEYGDGVVIQSYLSVPRYNDFRSDFNERWRLSVMDEAIEVDMPRRRYDFSPILLAKAGIEKYASPFVFDVCYRDERDCDKAAAGGYTAISHESNCSHVRLHSNNEKGWICGAIAAQGKPEVVDFVGGVVRIMRADWSGAQSSFQAVIENPDAETRMQIDARLYLAMSLAKMGKPSESVAQRAYDLNTTDQMAFKYLVMLKLAEWDKKIQAGHSLKALVDEIEPLLKANRILLSNNDPWLLALTSILDKAAT